MWCQLYKILVIQGTSYTDKILNISLTTRIHNCPTVTLTPHLPTTPLLQLYNFIISRILNKWNNVHCTILELTFLTEHKYLEIHLDCYMYQSFSIFFYCLLVFYSMDVQQLMSPFIHSRTSRLFPVFITNKAAINICVQVLE